ncbi:NAD(P)/FAD-dependent oxidoreductase [Dokdonella sp.]|uniref:FAD-dependent oxidoreductase n=1 Tax=Dokdonella sp. TaxID=2291710 RepID=UPI001B2271F1|nr:NAD(P)/FAD-dependent oxidoreductase [Dokdonella sp.]MBO9662170.1 FAD-dependent monooxygenase [Dokdonella sp.]
MKIGIVGYGSAGQAAALFLAREGHAIEIFERSSELRPVGAGFLLQPTGLGVLDALGLGADVRACGARIERLHGANAAGRAVMDMRYAEFAADASGLGMTRGALFALLHERCRQVAAIRTGARIASIAADGRHLVDGNDVAHGPYDLIVVADGSHSALRTSSGLLVRERLYPWGAMWCLLPADDWAHPSELRQRYDGTRTMLGVLPVGSRPGDADGRRWLTFYYSLPGAAVEGFDRAALARMQGEVAALWPELAERTNALDDPGLLNRARYRDVVLRRPWRERVVYVGDAAHGMSPQLGQGVNMALLDAQALAAALAARGDLAAALDDYARRRARHVAIYQFLSRWLTPLFQSDAALLAPLRDACFGPLGRLPLAKRHMLRILAGDKRRWW